MENVDLYIEGLTVHSTPGTIRPLVLCYFKHEYEAGVVTPKSLTWQEGLHFPLEMNCP